MYLSFVFQYNLKSVKIDYVGTNYWPIVLIEVLFSKYVYKYEVRIQLNTLHYLSLISEFQQTCRDCIECSVPLILKCVCP